MLTHENFPESLNSSVEGKYMKKEFLDCITDVQGRTWCFDREAGLVCKIKAEYVDSSSVPQDIFLQLLKVVSEKGTKCSTE